MGWGRNAALNTDGMPPPRKRYGLYSVLLGLAAPAIVLLAGSYIANLPNDAPEASENLATGLTLIAYGVVAPLMHIAGIVFGVAGLRSANAGKVSSIIGILLNIAMIGLGLLLGWAAVSTIGAFT